MEGTTLAPGTLIEHRYTIRRSLAAGGVAQLYAATHRITRRDVALKMPTRVELIGQIISAFMSPGSAIAGALVGVGNQIAGQVDAHSENLKKDEAGAPAPEAPPA